MAAMPLAASAQGIPYLRNYKAADYGAHNQNFDVFAAKDGTVFVANFEGLLYYDFSRWRIIHSQGITRITAVFQDSKGTVWTGGYNYFGFLKPDDKGDLTMVPCPSKKPFQGEVQWIWEKKGKIHFLASDKKVYVEHHGSYLWAVGEQVPAGDGKTYSVNVEINQVEDLGNGLQALATNGDGVVFVDKNGDEMFRVTEQNGLCSNNVSHMDYNHNGLLWGATDNGIFCISFPSIYSHFTSYEGLPGEVLSIAQLNSRVYAATLRGVFRLEGKTFRPLPQVTHACWQLAVQDSRLLAATSDGVWSITANGTATKLSDHSTMSLLAEGPGSYYSGEMDGVYDNAPGRRQKISDIEKVVKIMRDKEGTLWLQNLYGGIWKGDGKHAFTPFANGSEQEIMTLVDFGSQVTPIATHATTPVSFPLFSFRDTKGMLWLTNNKGKHLYAYHDDTVDPRMSAYVYPLLDNAVRTIMHDNMLWIGGDKGINVVDYTRKDPLKDLKPHLRSGYTDAIPTTAKALGDWESRQQILDSFHAFLDAWKQDHNVLRFRFYRPSELQQRLEELNLPRRSYETDMMELPQVRHFITEDDITDALRGRVPYRGGKEQLYAYWQQPHTAKEKVAYLKELYGTGGGNAAFSHNFHADEDHSGKGMRLRKPQCGDVLMTWPQVVKRIDKLMTQDRYLSAEEKAKLKAKREADKSKRDPNVEGNQ